ncbi:MAG TPA: hypothetical protein VFB22_06345 [Candidatus Baltobacteraceae bacterium]|nr:hypothetical protein [Candidatus Baltobacteraceae bacterium]
MLASLVFALVTGFAPQIAADAPAPPPAAPMKSLRHLVYSVTFGTRTKNVEHGSGWQNGGTMMGGGDAEVENVRENSDEGTLTVDVVAATGDGGLVVDAKFSGKQGDDHPVRVAIYSDGRIAYDPAKPLSIEAARFLPMLARGLVADHDVAPGQAWQIGPDAVAEHVTVTKVDGDVATLDLKKTLAPSLGGQEIEEGTALYDTAKVCPRVYDLVVRVRRPNGPDQEFQQTETLHARLVSDSFAKA